MKFLANLVIMLFELAAVVAAAAVAWRFPFWFAAATAMAALVLGARLEYLRLHNELTFYFDQPALRRRAWLVLVAGGEALFKALLAGVAAVLTVAGTDSNRLMLVAIVLASCLYIGTNTLRFLSIRYGARPARWGYFRLVAPLGLLFSVGLALLGELHLVSTPTLSDIGKRLVLELPVRPSVSQVSEFLFLMKQYFDSLVVGLLAVPLGPRFARLGGIVLSVNMLAGFVIAIYAVLISEVVRRLEGRWL